MIPEIRVDANQALALFSPAGIPEGVRRNLRRMIPSLTKRVGALVEDKIISGTKSWTNITVKKEMVESPSYLYGRVRVVWTGDKSKSMVPKWLEEGTAAHEIWAKGARPTGGGKGAKNLVFFWPKIGTWFVGPMVHHPGTKPLHYMRDSINEMQDEIVSTLRDAVITGAQQSDVSRRA